MKGGNQAPAKGCRTIAEERDHWGSCGRPWPLDSERIHVYYSNERRVEESVLYFLPVLFSLVLF